MCKIILFIKLLYFLFRTEGARKYLSLSIYLTFKIYIKIENLKVRTAHPRLK